VQAALLDHARGCGAEVLRGAVARELSDGKLPLLTVESREVSRGVRARLVVVASGRSRRLHTQLGHAVREDPKRLEIAGLLLDHVQITDEATRVVQDMRSGAAVLMFPLGSARVRVYLAYDKRAGDRRLSGTERVDTFFQECVRTGVPAPWIADARAAGPLASFAAHSTWVEQPYRDGVVFIGDAAGTSDPSFGAGLSLTLRDVRVLRDVLLADDDWDAAARCYAAQRDRYFAALRRIEGWLTDIFYTAGPRADALRASVLPRMARGAGPDVIGQGPDSPSDQAAYDALFGE
jgi:2-polyprenyl-6-methoxyphenol hydroxylase-like FAD-dependent oxidoreductase